MTEDLTAAELDDVKARVACYGIEPLTNDELDRLLRMARRCLELEADKEWRDEFDGLEDPRP